MSFLAIAQGRIANPTVLIDEIEKAPTQSAYGRLWDALLGFLEPETAERYRDPALQAPLDLSMAARQRSRSFRKPSLHDHRRQAGDARVQRMGIGNEVVARWLSNCRPCMNIPNCGHATSEQETFLTTIGRNRSWNVGFTNGDARVAAAIGGF
ncbi:MULTISPECIES: hypothetical protein [Rhodopseudomonas]|uniref:Uncharacterized protein n=2 Tax=Rhodopseudomonas TaxID=1073 RepID=A0A0D7F1R3_RHOPL|nr:hypothetical protein [Rhodopseudomonas sp. BAL398]KIZ46781.1 hypothetical protein OO17_06140 [Rhodopseudomonas palustris]WOK17601.1 hypothetical protein RBJ75_26385 [Rhodopseudomonas sp. BAL398]